MCVPFQNYKEELPGIDFCQLYGSSKDYYYDINRHLVVDLGMTCDRVQSLQRANEWVPMCLLSGGSTVLLY